MLINVSIRTRTKRAAVAAECVEPHRIDFVVSKDGQGAAGFDHRAYRSQHLADLWPSVDEIAQKDRLAPVRMPKGTPFPGVTKCSQKRHEFVRMAVDVSNDVVSLVQRWCLSGLSRFDVSDSGAGLSLEPVAHERQYPGAVVHERLLYLLHASNVSHPHHSE